MTQIKICGLTREADIDYVNEAKPDYIGFILSQNPIIVELQAAYKAMNEYLASVKGQVTFSCGGNCSSCAEACAAKPEQKDGEA